MQDAETAEAASQVRAFWLDEVGPEGWYKQSDALDDTVRSRFGALWQSALEGGCTGWLDDAQGTLAYLILTDQFPRNMFRGSARSFATDALALAAAKTAVAQDMDQTVEGAARQFFFMPMMHSEALADQDLCVRLMQERMPPEGGDNALHARVHREIIRRFGRFPYRNAALGRATTDEEAAFLDGGGYGEILNRLKDAP